jgi:hypothetical protein
MSFENNIEIQTNDNSEQEHPNLSTAWNEAQVMNSALDAGDITKEEAQAEDLDYENLLKKMLHTKMFVELPPERRMDEEGNIVETEGQALKKLLHTPYDEEREIIDTLAENNINLAIAMQEGFEDDPDMILCLKELNDRGITPTLWLVLSDEVGYWTNKANVEETIDKLERILNWKDRFDIQIDKIGIDYEPPLEFSKGLMSGNIFKMAKELAEYFKQARINRKKFGNLEKYLNYSILLLMLENNMPIEVYAAMEPLRSASNLLTSKPSPRFDVTTMAYTSAFKGDSDRNFNKKIESILNKVSEDEIPAIGIIGEDEDRTPGRDLRQSKDDKKLPEKHLSKEDLLKNLNYILGRENPFTTHYIFALDGPETLKMIIEARKNAHKEEE